jgi:RNA polymerase sigma factor
MTAVSINERVEIIKHSNEEIDRFVDEYKPFIAGCAQKVTGHYLVYGRDDELSIALIAFSEAIGSYDLGKGNFLSFAQNVIKRRLIDYYRKEKKHNKTISLSAYFKEENEDSICEDLSTNESVDRFTKEELNEYRRLEIEELKKELARWEISFRDLVEASPKHNSTRKIYSDIVRYIISQPILLAQLKLKKYLPILEIEKNTQIPRKKIERSRKYIIAVIIIATGDYQYLDEYISGIINKIPFGEVTE